MRGTLFLSLIEIQSARGTNWQGIENRRQQQNKTNCTLQGHVHYNCILFLNFNVNILLFLNMGFIVIIFTKNKDFILISFIFLLRKTL
jgi:hypothetical protein